MSAAIGNLNECGWIYICMDLRDPFSFKVGLTKATNIYERVSDTTNPYYMLIRGYMIPNSYITNLDCNRRSFLGSQWYYLERFIHKELEKRFNRVVHCMTGNQSEWFEGSLEAVIGEINYFFARTVDLLDDNGNYNINHLIYDQPITQYFFYRSLYKFAERNIYLDKLDKHFRANPMIPTFTLASTLNIPYIT